MAEVAFGPTSTEKVLLALQADEVRHQKFKRLDPQRHADDSSSDEDRCASETPNPRASLPKVAAKIRSIHAMTAVGARQKHAVQISVAKAQSTKRCPEYLDFLGRMLNNTPLMARMTNRLKSFQGTLFGKDSKVDIPALFSEISQALHDTKKDTSLAVWVAHVKPTRDSLSEVQRKFESLKAQFLEARSTYLKEVSELRDAVRVRTDPTIDMVADVRLFFSPINTLNDEERRFFLDLLRETLKTMLETKPSIVQNFNLDQLMSLVSRVETDECTQLKLSLQRKTQEIEALNQAITEGKPPQPINVQRDQMKLDGMIEALSAQADMLRSEKDELRSQLKIVKDQALSLEAERDEIRAQHSADSAEKLMLQEECEQLRVKFQQSQETQASLEQAVDMSDTTVLATLKDRDAQIADRDAKIANRDVKIAERDNVIKILNAKSEDMKARIKKMAVSLRDKLKNETEELEMLVQLEAENDKALSVSSEFNFASEETPVFNVAGQDKSILHLPPLEVDAAADATHQQKEYANSREGYKEFSNVSENTDAEVEIEALRDVEDLQPLGEKALCGQGLGVEVVCLKKKCLHLEDLLRKHLEEHRRIQVQTAAEEANKLASIAKSWGCADDQALADLQLRLNDIDAQFNDANQRLLADELMDKQDPRRAHSIADAEREVSHLKRLRGGIAMQLLLETAKKKTEEISLLPELETDNCNSSCFEELKLTRETLKQLKMLCAEMGDAFNQTAGIDLQLNTALDSTLASLVSAKRYITRSKVLEATPLDEDLRKGVAALTDAEHNCVFHRVFNPTQEAKNKWTEQSTKLMQETAAATFACTSRVVGKSEAVDAKWKQRKSKLLESQVSAALKYNLDKDAARDNQPPPLAIGSLSSDAPITPASNSKQRQSSKIMLGSLPAAVDVSSISSDAPITPASNSKQRQSSKMMPGSLAAAVDVENASSQRLPAMKPSTVQKTPRRMSGTARAGQPVRGSLPAARKTGG